VSLPSGAQTEDDVSKIHEADRVGVKSVIVSLMLTAPAQAQKQLSEALTLIAENDFPRDWTNLLPVSPPFASFILRVLTHVTLVKHMTIRS